MKMAIIGATGYTGSRILTEALDRGHAVTAIVRDIEKLPTHSRLTAAECDVTDQASLSSLLPGNTVVVSAFNPGNDETGKGINSIIQAVKHASARLVVVGGAGSLEVVSGQRLVDQPNFPSAWKDGALNTAAFLEILRCEHELDWSFVSPAAKLSPGKRTGEYRVGGDHLLTDEDGESHISVEDFADAMLDEIEQPIHRRTRFSVAY